MESKDGGKKKKERNESESKKNWITIRLPLPNANSQHLHIFNGTVRLTISLTKIPVKFIVEIFFYHLHLV